MRNQRGFTLVELLVVIAMIVCLSIIVWESASEKNQPPKETEKEYCLKVAKYTPLQHLGAGCLQYLQPVTESHEIKGATEADCTNIHPVLYREAREACDKYNASLLKIIQ